MNTVGYELEVHRQQSLNLNQNLNGTLQNCQQLYPYQQLTPQWYYCHCQPSLSAFELTITQTCADQEPLLNYGAKLRLMIADPIKGIDLREAISKLKIALKEAYHGN